MQLSPEDRNRLRFQVERFRRVAGVNGRVDLEICVEVAGVKGPFPLFSDDDEHYLRFRNGVGGDDLLPDAIGGLIDPFTLEIFINEQMPEKRRRFVLSHELQHYLLGHCEVMARHASFTRDRRGEMEAEASFAAVELLCPTTQLKRVTHDASSPGSRPGLRAVIQAAEVFDITSFTALRHYVSECASLPTALLSLQMPRDYRGAAAPRHIHQKGLSNPAWSNAKLPSLPDRVTLDVLTVELAWRAHALLASRRSPELTEGVRHILERHYRAEVELLVSSRSVHCLLHGSSHAGRAVSHPLAL